MKTPKTNFPKHKHRAPPLLNTTLVECHYDYCLCLSEKDFKTALKRFGVPKHNRPVYEKRDDGAITYEFDTKKYGLCIIVVLNPNTKASMEHIYSVLVHEAVHVWQMHRNWIEERFPSAEFEAYSIQAICRNFFYAYNEQKALNK